MALTKAHLALISDISSRLEGLASEVENLAEDLQADFDEKSEKWQESEAGEAMSSHISDLEGIAGEITDAASSLNDIN